jgi:hypothetical protein
MAPIVRLTIWLWQLFKRRLSRMELTIYAVAIMAALSIASSSEPATGLRTGRSATRGAEGDPALSPLM